MLIKLIDKLNRFFHKRIFISKSKIISKLIKKVVKKNFYFSIVDVGAGARYLPPVLNFDGVSKIFMIDPNKNLDVSVSNLSRVVKFKKNIVPIKTGIYGKNTTLNYYLSSLPTSSSFINYEKGLNPIRQKVHTFSFIRKKYKIKKIDVLKVDIEGLELKILKEILKFQFPLIIEIEVNFKNSVFGDTFTPIHNFLSKKYFLTTAFPSYIGNKKKFNGHLKPFRIGKYDSPSFRNPLYQMDCYYILKKKNYDFNDILLLIGYGLLDESKKIYKKIYKNLNKNQRENIISLLKILS
jgi:FkbM family methyltransferase